MENKKLHPEKRNSRYTFYFMSDDAYSRYRLVLAFQLRAMYVEQSYLSYYEKEKIDDNLVNKLYERGKMSLVEIEKEYPGMTLDYINYKRWTTPMLSWNEEGDTICYNGAPSSRVQTLMNSLRRVRQVVFESKVRIGEKEKSFLLDQGLDVLCRIKEDCFVYEIRTPSPLGLKSVEIVKWPDEDSEDSSLVQWGSPLGPSLYH